MFAAPGGSAYEGTVAPIAGARNPCLSTSDAGFSQVSGAVAVHCTRGRCAPRASRKGLLGRRRMARAHMAGTRAAEAVGPPSVRSTVSRQTSARSDSGTRDSSVALTGDLDRWSSSGRLDLQSRSRRPDQLGRTRVAQPPPSLQYAAKVPYRSTYRPASSTARRACPTSTKVRRPRSIVRSYSASRSRSEPPGQRLRHLDSQAGGDASGGTGEAVLDLLPEAALFRGLGVLQPTIDDR